MNYKILHTADWHLGRKFHDLDLAEYHLLFFNWLLDFIKDEEVNLLLTSGDAFDLANPSQESQKLYYHFLSQLSSTSCAAIITAGNHDSPGLIDAPSGILETLKIHVVGAAPENKDELIFPLKNKSGEVFAAVAAVPFLRDRDVKRAVESETYDSRIEAVRSGMENYFLEVKERMNVLFPNTLHIAMGHLFAANASPSDTERDIQVGNQALFPISSFENLFDYVALGHIHKAQSLGLAGKIRYSGSPLPMSFSEKNYSHQVVLVEINGASLSHKEIKIPREFELIGIQSNLQKLKEEMSHLFNRIDTKTFFDITVEEDNYDPKVFSDLEVIIDDLQQNQFCKVLQRRVKFKNNSTNLVSPEQMGSADELSPEFIYSQMISTRDQKEKNQLMEIFFEIKQKVEEDL